MSSLQNSQLEIHDWARRILSADTMEDKLFAPNILTDLKPGPAERWKEPSRPRGMELGTRSKDQKLPCFQEHGDQDKRAICLHRFAGHELLAVEIMAFALLAFPDAPKHFRRGLANTLQEEQEHVRLYMECMRGMGLEFGDLPLYRHFWVHTPSMATPNHYISTMCLTLEMANLDFAPMYGQSFSQHGDEASANLMKRILTDEIKHVGFGINWLRKMKDPNVSEWDTWVETLSPFFNPGRAKGFLLHEEHRLAAGITQEWIDKVKNYKHQK